MFKIAIKLTCIFVLLFSSFAFSSTRYEGPNGEVYIGDYLPQELRDKGYKVNGGIKEDPVISAGSRVKTGESSVTNDNSAGQKFFVALPMNSWAIEIDKAGFDVQKYSFTAEGKSVYIVAENRLTGIFMSVFAEKSPVKGDSRDARKFYWDGAKTHPVADKDVKRYEKGNISFIEYIVKSIMGTQANQKNIYAYLVKNDTWAYIHLSKTDFKPGDERLFDALLKTVRVKESYVPDAFENSRFGHHYYQQKKYKEAIPYYERSVAQYRKDAKLDRKVLYLVIEDLGIAYAYSGDSKKAMATFKYGESVDPKYPRFLYDISCLYAEGGELDNAISYLRKAFKNKSFAAPGRPLPDPLKDESFKNYYRNDKFVKAVREL